MSQEKKPLPPQTAHKAWAAAFGALAANVVIWLLAYGDVVTAAETSGLLVTLFTPAGAGLAAYAKRNWATVIGCIPCHPFAVAVAAAILLAGCADWTLDGRIDPREARILDDARQERPRASLIYLQCSGREAAASTFTHIARRVGSPENSGCRASGFAMAVVRWANVRLIRAVRSVGTLPVEWHYRTVSRRIALERSQEPSCPWNRA